MPIVGGGGGSGTGSGIVQVSQVALSSGDLTTSSTSFVDATGLTTTLTTGAHRCLVLFSGTAQNNTTQANTCIDIAIDGTRQGQGFGLVHADNNGGSLNLNMSFSYLTAALSAGSHTIKIQWKVDVASTAKLWASTVATPSILTVLELGL